MSQYYKDAEDLYRIYGYFLDRVLKDEKIGTKMSKAGIIIKFMYTDPDAEITIDLKNRRRSPAITAPSIWALRSQGGCVVQAAGRPFPPVLARPGKSDCRITKGIIKQGGKVTAMLKLLPVIKPAFQLFPVALRNGP
jgi:hypothetical protein